MIPLVSVVIPTYRRAPFLKYALEGLKKQSYRNFEVIIVVKPGGDETKNVIEQHKHVLTIKTIEQDREYVSRAYNLGIEAAEGKIVAIMDDDSVPDEDWLKKHVSQYAKDDNLGGVSGATLDAEITGNGKLRLIKNVPKGSVSKRWQKRLRKFFSFDCPLQGMSNWWIFIGRDGLVHSRELPVKKPRKAMLSLLYMGANMSIRKDAIKDLEIDENLILGFSYEQLLGYQIWRKGYRIIHDSNIKVLHIAHHESLGRFFQTSGRAAHRDAEYILSFFILKPTEPQISWLSYLPGFVGLVVGRALSVARYGFNIALARIYGLLYGFVIGCALTISHFIGGAFSVKAALEKFM